MTTDPYGQFHSPYLGMGNNPINGIDPDGGLFGRQRAWLHKLFSGGSIHQRTDGKWAWQKGTSIANENGDLTGVNIQYKNFGYEGLGKFDTSGVDASTNVYFDAGLVKSRDYGVAGTTITGPTIRLLESKYTLFDNGNLTNKFDNYYIGKDLLYKGKIGSLNIEGGKGDYKAGLEWQSKGLIIHNGVVPLYVPIPGETRVSSLNGGVGAPFVEAKVHMDKHGIRFSGGFQEDWGGSLDYYGLGILGKVGFKVLGEATWKF